MARAYNSTIKIKQKTCVRCGFPKYIFSRGRCVDCARIEDNKDEEVAPEGDLSGLIQDADVLVSRFVRMSAANKYGMVDCFTCPREYSWKEMDCGHYIPRANMYLRYDLRNLRPQCHLCNRGKYGQAAIFAQRLEKEFPGLPELLLEESRIVYHTSREELRQIISEYTQKIKNLKQKK